MVFLIPRVGETEGAEELVLEVVTTVEDVAVLESMYISNRFPAPQYS